MIETVSKAKIRKLQTVVEETRLEMGQAVDPPTRQAAAVAVILNPLAGKFRQDLTVLEEIGAELGALLGRRAVAALEIAPEQVHSYGKAAVVGQSGEKEHAAAILHPRLGKPFRKVVGGGVAIIPSTVKVGGPGTTVDCPLHHKDEMWTFSHFDAMEVSVSDAPRADEIVVIVTVTDSGRPLHRVGEDLGLADVMPS